ncbi:MAG TPA: dihydropteroate synthase [Burkholderiales bacterium]|nr:dihydropteroate synthase [Burkholderiales bacterium]
MKHTTLSRDARSVAIGGDLPTVLIGERINPTGRKRFSEALRNRDFAAVRAEAIAQRDAGADLLDVNASLAGVDEVALYPEVVACVMEAVDLPLCLDSPNADALAAGLRVYQGKALVNSVTAEEQSLARVLPLVKAHSAAVIALLQGNRGIPSDADGRVALAGAILERCAALSIPAEDVVVDCMAMTVGTDHNAARVTLETIRRVRQAFGVNVVLGASNISFGMPDRELLNAAFIAQAIAAGATCLITDAAKVRATVLAADLLQGRDEYAGRYLLGYRQRQKQAAVVKA